MKNKKGFTLTETIIMIVLVCVLFLIAVPIINILTGTTHKKQTFESRIKNIAREYDEQENEYSIVLGQRDLCEFQTDCVLKGIIKRDENDNIIIRATDGKHCINGLLDDYQITSGTCGINEKIVDIVFNDQTYVESYNNKIKKIEVELTGGSGNIELEKLSEKRNGVVSNDILVNGSMIIIPANTNVGTYTLVLKAQDVMADMEEEAEVILKIEKANISEMEIEDIEDVEYKGSAYKPEPKVSQNGKELVKNVDYKYSYSNNKNVGTAKVIIIGIGNYEGEVTKTFEIVKKGEVIEPKENIKSNESVNTPKTTKKTNNVNISSVNLTYNGNSQVLIQTTNNEVYYSIGKELTSTNYKTIGSTIKPSKIDAGTYKIYYYIPEGTYYEVKGSVTSIINPQTLKIPSSPQAKTVSSEVVQSGITCPNGSIASGTQQAKDVGIYTQTCTLNSNNYKWSDNSTTPKNISWEIVKTGGASIGSCNVLTYNGQSQTLVSGGSYVSYTNNLGTDAGTYEVIVKADNNHKFSDETTSKTISCTINPKVLDIPLSPQAKSYTGSTQNSGITCPNGSSASGSLDETNAGSYTQTCTLSSNNYKWSDNTITPKNISWIINPKVLDIPLSPQAKSYTGSTQNSGIICPNGSSTTGDINGTSAGTYTQTCSLDSLKNYIWNDNTTTIKNINWVINGLNTATTGRCNVLTYNGQSQVLVSGGSYVSYVNNQGIDSDTYEVTINANNNYTFNDGTKTKQLNCSISKATPTMDLPATNGTVQMGTSGSIAIIGSNYGTLSCSSSNPSIASCSASGSVVTITPGQVGVATLTIRGSGNNNYSSIQKTYEVTITQAYKCTEGVLTPDSTKGANSGGYICVRGANSVCVNYKKVCGKYESNNSLSDCYAACYYAYNGTYSAEHAACEQSCVNMAIAAPPAECIQSYDLCTDSRYECPYGWNMYSTGNGISCYRLATL